MFGIDTRRKQLKLKVYYKNINKQESPKTTFFFLTFMIKYMKLV